MPSGICLEGCNDKQIHQIDVGECNIGRGWLNCDDKRISRKHGTIKVYDDSSILLTAMHQNPLFYKNREKDLIEAVPKNSDIALNIGDSFGLLPDLYWFKIVDATPNDLNDTPDLDELACAKEAMDADIPCQTSNNSTPSDETNTSAKRKLPTWFTASDNKKRKSNNVGGSAANNETQQEEEEPMVEAANDALPMDETVQAENDDQIKPEVDDDPIPPANAEENADEDAMNLEQQEVLAPADPSLEEESSNHEPPADENIPAEDYVQVKPEPEDESTSDSIDFPTIAVKQEIPDQPNAEEELQNVASTSNRDPVVSNQPVKQEKGDSQCVSSTTSSLRESCTYGIRCYRRNLEHRAEQAHPGDSDYRRPNYDDPPAGTPPCPFGANCYRRNPEHFKQFSHPPSTDPKANRRAKRTANKQKSDDVDNRQDEDSADLDDEEEPFGTDTSDDDYDPDKDSQAESDVSFDEVDTQDLSPE